MLDRCALQRAGHFAAVGNRAVVIGGIAYPALGSMVIERTPVTCLCDPQPLIAQAGIGPPNRALMLALVIFFSRTLRALQSRAAAQCPI